MKYSKLTLTLAGGILTALAIVAIIAVKAPMQEETENNLYVYPLAAGGKTYTVTILTDWPNEPKVYFPEFDPVTYFSFDFIGPERKQFYFNVTYPNSLVGEDVVLIWKYYPQNSDLYTISGNGTHRSIYMMFNHTATVEHFEIRSAETS